MLARVEAWLSRASGETVAWVLFLVGLHLVAGGVPDQLIPGSAGLTPARGGRAQAAVPPGSRMRLAATTR